MSIFNEKQRTCEAITGKGSQCKKPRATIDGIHQRLCRQHSSAPGGAPRNNANAVRSGRYTAAAKKERRQLRAHLVQMTETLSEITDTLIFGEMP